MISNSVYIFDWFIMQSYKHGLSQFEIKTLGE